MTSTPLLRGTVLSEDLTVYHPAKSRKQVFVFDRSRAPLVAVIAGRLRERLESGRIEGAGLSRVAPVLGTGRKQLVSA